MRRSHWLVPGLMVLVSASSGLAQERGRGSPAASVAVKPVLVIQRGHTGRVRSVALSGDGKWLVTGSQDNTARLWETATGREVRTFRGHKDAINSVGLSRDGRWLVTGSGGTVPLEVDEANDKVSRHALDESARLWDVTTGKPVRAFKGNTGPVHAVALSADGKLLVTGSDDNTARLWDVGTGKRLRVFRGHTAIKPFAGRVRCVALSPDARWLVTGGDDDTARLWEVSTGEQLRVLRGHTSLVASVAFSGDGKRVATAGSSDRTARLWSVASGAMIRAFRHADWVDSVALSPDGKWLAITSTFEKVTRLWQTETGKEVRSFTGHAATLDGLAFSADGKWLVTDSVMLLPLRSSQARASFPWAVRRYTSTPSASRPASGSGLVE
jgi:WD40 repeat protein